MRVLVVQRAFFIQISSQVCLFTVRKSPNPRCVPPHTGMLPYIPGGKADLNGIQSCRKAALKLIYTSISSLLRRDDKEALLANPPTHQPTNSPTPALRRSVASKVGNF